MTISLPDVRLGVQRPRIMVAPPSVTTAGREAADLAELAGLHLDPWQRYALDVALGERADGKWSAFEVGLIVSRQNGKGSILEAIELAKLFLFGDELILHSAHEFKTAAEGFRRVLNLVEGCDDLRKRVMRVRTSHGEEGIELRTGQRLRFVARSNGSGRGFTADCLILDEAMVLGAETMAALLPTLSARPNPQVWYTASAPLATSTQLHAVRRRALRGGDGALCYLEWSAPDDCDPDDHEAWAQANPALGIRITEEFIERERAALPTEVFMRERLSVPDMPPDDMADAAIPAHEWAACADPTSAPGAAVVFGVDVSPDRDRSAVGVASMRADGRVHVEVPDARAGTEWLSGRLVELCGRWGGRVALDPTGPAGALLRDLRAAGLDVVEVQGREVVQSCGRLYDLVADGRLVHLGDSALSDAVGGARRKVSGDAWRWDRRKRGADITPLYAVTFAAWVAAEAPEPEAEWFVY